MEEVNGNPLLSQADLLSLPEEVILRSILPNLDYNDILRLRRACQTTKHYSDQFLQKNFKSQVREINQTNYSFHLYLQADLPTNSIYINNSSPSIFEDPSIAEFLRLYGSQITHVRIHHFGTFISPSELHFFSNLPNLLHLDITFIDASKRDCTTIYAGSLSKTRHENCTVFPENFKNLLTLKLNEIQGSGFDDQGYFLKFLEFCQKLEYLKHPFYQFKRLGYQMNPFEFVKDYIEKRHEMNPNLPNLQFIDLANEDRGESHNSLIDLYCTIQIKLLNMKSNWVFNIGRFYIFRHNNIVLRIPQFAVLAVSLRNIHAYVLAEELPNLEKLVIETIRGSKFAESWKWPRDPTEQDRVPLGGPKWPKLKILDLTIDSSVMPAGEDFPESLTTDLFQFLFPREPENRREGLRELAIRYNASNAVEDIEELPVPGIRDITDSCLFVTKLTLTSWMGREEEVTLFWEGLPLLEEVELEKCEKLGNRAFIGKGEREGPVFLKLKNLKKLSLKGLESMRKITDLVFKVVFCRLKIKEFRLTSDETLKSVTASGIESLVNGDFNSSVEKFPFDGWSLKGVSEEEFLQMRLKFRASHMI